MRADRENFELGLGGLEAGTWFSAAAILEPLWNFPGARGSWVLHGIPVGMGQATMRAGAS